MKHLLSLLLVCNTIFAQSDFLKKYTLAPNIGIKLFKQPMVTKARFNTPLMLVDEKKMIREIVDSVMAGQSVELIELLGLKNNTWVVRYKNKPRIMDLGELRFDYDIDLYNRVLIKESTRLKNEEDQRAKNIEKSLMAVESSLQKLQKTIDSDKERYAKEISNEEVDIGMPPHIVIASWGEPTRKVTSKRASGTFMIWYYDKRSSSVTFYNGKVDDITTSN